MEKVKKWLEKNAKEINSKNSFEDILNYFCPGDFGLEDFNSKFDCGTGLKCNECWQKAVDNE